MFHSLVCLWLVVKDFLNKLITGMIYVRNAVYIKASVFGLLLVVIAGCAAQRTPVQTIEQYLNARVEANETTLRQLSCNAWEEQAALEAASFGMMNASLENMVCQAGAETTDGVIVTCSGQMNTNYNGESRSRALGSYQVIQEAGEWRMCGEAAP